MKWQPAQAPVTRSRNPGPPRGHLSVRKSVSRHTPRTRTNQEDRPFTIPVSKSAPCAAKTPGRTHPDGCRLCAEPSAAVGADPPHCVQSGRWKSSMAWLTMALYAFAGTSAIRMAVPTISMISSRVAPDLKQLLTQEGMAQPNLVRFFSLSGSMPPYDSDWSIPLCRFRSQFRVLRVFDMVLGQATGSSRRAT